MLNSPAALLRLEEAALLVASILLYHHLNFSWPLFAILILAPDLSMLGYLLNPKTGAALYNLGHVLFLPLPLLLIAYGNTGRSSWRSPSSGSATSPSIASSASG